MTNAGYPFSLHRTVFAKEFGSGSGASLEDQLRAAPPAAAGVAAPPDEQSPEQSAVNTSPHPSQAASGGAEEAPTAEPAGTADRQRRIEAFAGALVRQSTTGPDCGEWAKGVDAFLRRWEGTSTAGQLSILHGAVPGRGRNATRIGVQPTATARRRSTTLRGRGRVPSGRPAKEARTAEHGYSAANGLNEFLFIDAIENGSTIEASFAPLVGALPPLPSLER